MNAERFTRIVTTTFMVVNVDSNMIVDYATISKNGRQFLAVRTQKLYLF